MQNENPAPAAAERTAPEAGLPPCCQHSSHLAEPPRRGFFKKFLAGVLGVAAGLVPFGAGLAFFFDPLVPKRKNNDGKDSAGGVVKDAEGFVKMDVTLESLPEDGTPQAFKVYDDKVDAWNKFLNVEIGTVWLRKTKDGQVLAFNTICPHLGCAVDFRQASGDFYCPCHTSRFDLDGRKLNPIPPRGMDELQVKLKPETGDAIWLKYENFRGATPEKIPVS